MSNYKFRMLNKLKKSTVSSTMNYGYSAFSIQHSALRSGFTLMEMLVVVALIAMLLSGVLVLVQGAQAKARDTNREQHIKTIQNALALYASLKGRYPVYDGFLTGLDPVSAELKNTDSLPQMPLDPLNRALYRYSYTSPDGATYSVKYYLETGTIPGKNSGLNTVIP